MYSWQLGNYTYDLNKICCLMSWMHQAVLYQMLGKADEVCNFIFLYKVTFLFSSQSVAHIEKSQNLLTNEHKQKKK